MTEQKEDTRKGFLTPEQEQQLDDLYDADGVRERIDGVVIKLADNQGLERLKPAIIEKWPDALPMIYEVIDGIFKALPDFKEG